VIVLDVVLIGCLVLVAVGAGLIFMPAGLIVGGLLGAATVLFYVRGLDLDRTPDRPGA